MPTTKAAWVAEGTERVFETSKKGERKREEVGKRQNYSWKGVPNLGQTKAL